MAIHDSVLLGAMSQSVDNLTMCVCRKLRIVRHKAKHVTNPRTDAYSGGYPFSISGDIRSVPS